MNKLVVSVEFTNNHNRILRISLESKLNNKKNRNTEMLSGDNMICYLLFLKFHSVVLTNGESKTMQDCRQFLGMDTEFSVF